MKQEDFFEILEGLDEQYIVEAEEPVTKRRLSRKKLMLAIGLAAAACLCLFLFGGRKIELSRSKGVRVSYTSFVPGIGAEACLVYLTEEELFTEWSDAVFKGTVTKIDNIKLNFNGSTDYRALAEVQVEKVYRGTCKEGETIRMLLPGAVMNGSSNSIMDTLGKLKVGMNGIFMPMAYGIDSVYQSNGATLYLGELAPYGFGDGIRFAFLETEAGLVFDRSAYMGAKDASTLEEIEVYVEQMLELYFGADASDRQKSKEGPQRPSVLSAFLGRITRNLSFNRYKLLHTQKRGGGELPLILSELGDCVSGKESVEREIDRKELLSEINGFLAGLSKDKRQMFVRRYWYAESVKDIAKRFGVSEGSVTMTMKRMREQLKDVLTKSGYVL